MADITVTPGTGKTVATDTVEGTREFQLVKLDFGAAGATSMATSGNPFPVTSTDLVGVNAKLPTLSNGRVPTEVQEKAITTVNTPAIGTTTGNIIAANSNTRWSSIQNLGTNPLYVLLGSGASATVFHQALAGGASNDDGKGGSYGVTGYKGIISVFGISPRYTYTTVS
jgi:hypothetical protein